MANIICNRCNNSVDEESDFCSFCGALFIEDVTCINHQTIAAQGVCVICGDTFCSNCGGWKNNKYFCGDHNEYEVYENMAKVYGSNDFVQTHFAADTLKREGINAVIFNRKASPMHLGGTDYSLFRASGDFNGHIINEIKVMVPFYQVQVAEEILKELNIEI